MAAIIVDRRSGITTKDRNIGNRQRYIDRAKDVIKPQLREAIKEGKIVDIANGKVTVPIKGTVEPTFGQDYNTGKHRRVLPGNKHFVPGDTQDKPPSGKGGGSGKQGSDTGEGKDGFNFTLTKEEFYDLLMDELELPDIQRKRLKDMTVVIPKRTGFSSSGNPAQLDRLQTLRKSLGRRIGLKRPKRHEIEDLEFRISQEIDETNKNILVKELEELNRRIKVIPWIDPIDVKYRAFTPQPQPVTKAVVFFLMDVSASMGEREKYISKIFFLLLYILVVNRYTKTDVVFVRHTHEATESTEDDFFYGKDTGGTVVSSGIEKISEIIKERYPVEDYNIYVAQSGDSENSPTDNAKAKQKLDDLIPLCQYYAYIDVSEVMDTYHMPNIFGQFLDVFYELMKKHKNLQVKEISHAKEVWGVFSDLFKKGSKS